ncbi:MAG: glycogen synthase [Rhodothermales bacterium]|nr:glycogen synthase [Rhodothermales bacterium]
MADAIRILFISGEVAPFTEENGLSHLVRNLPEQIHNTGSFQTRIMMPRYGTISERRNRLHEVIRLSGTEVEMGEESHTLKVKVASIPGIRLQVYFMDNTHYFKRKGILADRDAKPFSDNGERALFFGRGCLETIKNLGWAPDIIHAFGWAGSLVPLVLRSEFGSDPLFENSKCIYTPDDVDPSALMDEEMASQFGLDVDKELIGGDLCQVGLAYADGIAYPSHIDPSTPDVPQFSMDLDEIRDLGCELYEQVCSDVAV